MKMILFLTAGLGNLVVGAYAGYMTAAGQPVHSVYLGGGLVATSSLHSFAGFREAKKRTKVFQDLHDRIQNRVENEPEDNRAQSDLDYYKSRLEEVREEGKKRATRSAKFSPLSCSIEMGIGFGAGYLVQKVFN